MPPALDEQPHARAVLGPAFAGGRDASHAYLFHGPGGAGKRAAARLLAAELLSGGSRDPAGARARVETGAHPDLTWITPSGAHEILVSDIAEPVIAASSRTPFESDRRVFVIERVDELGDEAANRMLKTLEEPPRYVHLILLTDRLSEVLPTIRSRCQLVRFDPPPLADIAMDLERRGAPADTAAACARLSLGDGTRAAELATAEGAALRAAAEHFAQAVLAGDAAGARPWVELLSAVRARGERVRSELEAAAAADLELYPKKERKRVENEWSDRTRRARRRVETTELDLGLQLVSLWFVDHVHLGLGADDLVRNVDRLAQFQPEGRPELARLRRAIEFVEDTRLRFSLNVSEELACEALAYRIEHALHE